MDKAPAALNGAAARAHGRPLARAGGCGSRAPTGAATPKSAPRAREALLAAALAGGLLAGACSAPSSPEAVARIVLSPDKALLVGAGDGERFHATPVDQDGAAVSASVTWSAGDTGVATVSSGGFVTAVATGTTTITAAAGSAGATAVVEVWAPPPVARYAPGVSYFGRKGYVEYVPGTLPVILSAAHDGQLAPAEIPDRTWGTLGNDLNTLDLTRRMRQALIDLTGGAPHMILSHLRRRKLDPNREIDEAAQGDPYAELAWEEFHQYVRVARAIVSGDYADGGMYFDVHGHSHDIPRVELGYLLTADDLNQGDARLNNLDVVRRSSLREIGRTSPLPFSQVLRGSASFGALLAREGVRSVPSPAEPGPGGDPYWRGGYNTRVHGSLSDGEVVSGIQLEHHRPGLRDTPENRQAYAEKAARAIRAFMQEHFGHFGSGG